MELARHTIVELTRNVSSARHKLTAKWHLQMVGIPRAVGTMMAIRVFHHSAHGWSSAAPLVVFAAARAYFPMLFRFQPKNYHEARYPSVLRDRHGELCLWELLADSIRDG
jgi:hypothetical protein